jgi:uncharacterized protein YktB (UPF0637 family)
MVMVESAAFIGFTNDDFDVFSVPGLSARMDALKKILRPKLAMIGARIAPIVGEATGREMYAHVALHARRKTNPPHDSWVALSQDRRGYKKWPTWMIGLWRTHLFIQMGVIYESPLKGAFGKAVGERVDMIRAQLPDSWQLFPDHTVPEGIKLSELSNEQFRDLALRAVNVKSADLLFGCVISRENCLTMRGTELMNTICDTCVRLAPLYDLAFSELGAL